jgi:hypothetical protein
MVVSLDPPRACRVFPTLIFLYDFDTSDAEAKRVALRAPPTR